MTRILARLSRRSRIGLGLGLLLTAAAYIVVCGMLDWPPVARLPAVLIPPLAVAVLGSGWHASLDRRLPPQRRDPWVRRSRGPGNDQGESESGAQ